MKKYFSLLPLLLLAALFSVCGLFLPKLLMNRQQNSLLTKTETMLLPTMTDIPGSRTFQKFQPEKLLQIASSYGNHSMDYWWITYTPEEGQLTTEELIQVAHQQIDHLCELGILPELFSRENYTYEGVEHGIPWTEKEGEYSPGDSCEPDSDFSGWVVSGGNSHLSITVHVNSSSGQILKLSASWNSADSSSCSESGTDILKQYLKYLELETEPVSYYQEGDYAICLFENYHYALIETLDPADISEENAYEQEDEAHIWYHLSLSVLDTDSFSAAEIELIRGR